MASTKLVMVNLRVNKIPDEYMIPDYKWLEMSERRYMLTTTPANIALLKRDRRVIVCPDESYQLYG